MRVKKYQVPYASEIVALPKFFKLQCCDCGSVHSVELGVTKDGLQARFEKDQRASTMVRKKGLFKFVEVKGYY